MYALSAYFTPHTSYRYDLYIYDTLRVTSITRGWLKGNSEALICFYTTLEETFGCS